MLGTAFLLANFTVSHTTTDVRDTDIGWVRPAAVHTVNLPSSYLLDWWMGYLNLQIEHHLFLTMPQFRHPRLAEERIKPFFKAHGLTYKEVGFVRAHYDVYRNLRQVAKSASTNVAPSEHD